MLDESQLPCSTGAVRCSWRQLNAAQLARWAAMPRVHGSLTAQRCRARCPSRQAVVGRCMAHDPEARPSAEDVLNHLDAMLTSEE